MNKKDKFFIPKLIICIVGAAFGAFLIIYSFTSPFYHYGDYAKSYTFGADFYTEQYEATRVVSSNVYAAKQTLESIGNLTCLAIGAAFLLGFLLALFCVLSNHQKLKAESTQAAIAAPAPQTIPATESIT